MNLRRSIQAQILRPTLHDVQDGGQGVELAGDGLVPISGLENVQALQLQFEDPLRVDGIDLQAGDFRDGGGVDGRAQAENVHHVLGGCALQEEALNAAVEWLGHAAGLIGCSEFGKKMAGRRLDSACCRGDCRTPRLSLCVDMPENAQRRRGNCRLGDCQEEAGAGLLDLEEISRAALAAFG